METCLTEKRLNKLSSVLDDDDDDGVIVFLLQRLTTG